MKLKQWRDYGWADTEELQKQYEENAKKHAEEVAQREEDAKNRYEAGEISKAEYETLFNSIKNGQLTIKSDVAGDMNNADGWATLVREISANVNFTLVK